VFEERNGVSMEKQIVSVGDLRPGWDVKFHKSMDDSPYGTFHVIKNNGNQVILHRYFIHSENHHNGKYVRPYISWDELTFDYTNTIKFEVWEKNNIL
jgi:hypothetical protein